MCIFTPFSAYSPHEGISCKEYMKLMSEKDRKKLEQRNCAPLSMESMAFNTATEELVRNCTGAIRPEIEEREKEERIRRAKAEYGEGRTEDAEDDAKSDDSVDCGASETDSELIEAQDSQSQAWKKSGSGHPAPVSPKKKPAPEEWTAACKEPQPASVTEDRPAPTRTVEKAVQHRCHKGKTAETPIRSGLWARRDGKQGAEKPKAIPDSPKIR